MPLDSTLNGTRACSRCRQKKVHCGREAPSCRVCEKAGVNCTYPSTNARYAVSRMRSCTQCRKQRARCDRKRPCSSCTSSGVECIYKNVENLGAERDGGSEAGGLSPHELTDSQSPVTTSANETSVSDFRNQSILLASNPFPVNVTSLHPSVPQIWLLWHTYLENVDPLYKILHAPSFERLLLRGIQDLQAMDADVETLLFAVYFAGIVGSTNEHCLNKFNEAKLVLLKRYRHALETCLTRSGFLLKPRFTSLQAFVLYITTALDAPLTAPVDALLALAIQLAMKLDIHRDYSPDQQEPLVFISLADKTESELRRRLWWHILTLDVLTAESAGTDPKIIEGTWDARPPDNIDDGELDAYSDLPLPPGPGETFTPYAYAMHKAVNDYTAHELGRRTDMSYVLTRMEIFHRLRRHTFSEQFCKINRYEYLSNPASRIQFLDDLARNLNMKYLQHCQRNDIFSFFVRNAAKLILSKHLMLAKKTGSARESLHNGVQVLEAAVGLRRTHARWIWSLRSYVELDALEVLLDCLTGIQAESARGDSEYEAQIQHARALAQAAVQRGREHDLRLCYPEHWERIEALQKKIEEE